MVEALLNLNEFLEENWPKEFNKICLKRSIIKLNARFLKYLNKDGVIIHKKYNTNLDKQSEGSDFELSDEAPEERSKNKSQNEEEEEEGGEELADENDPDIEFPEFEKDIEAALEKFDRAVFLKLNWKAPRESEGWVPQLKCQSIGDIFLLLKSSGRLGEMIENIFGELKEKDLDDETLSKRGGLILILRKWYPLNTAREFRVFIAHGKILGVSQRSIQHFFPYLKQKEEQENILKIISNFFQESVSIHMKSHSYVIDVYIDVPPKNRVWLIDIAPWHEITNSLLFSWEELAELCSNEKDPVFKFVPNETDIYKENYVKFNFPQEMSSQEKMKEFMSSIEK